MASTSLMLVTFLLLLVQIVVVVKAKTLVSTYIATPAAPGGGVLGRSNALGCGRVCVKNTTCKGYFVADNSPDSCVIFTDGSSSSGTTSSGAFYWKVLAAENPRTCAEMALQLGADLPNGQYQVDPDGPGGLDPITVTCNTSSDSTIWTYADHDRILTTIVKGTKNSWERGYGYRHTITYEDSLTQLKALTALSNSCRMGVHIECYAVLFEDAEGRHLAGWVAYNGTVFPMTQGGDVCPRMTKTLRKCNCNNDAVWRIDTGYITDKDNFPVQALAFGDMGPGGSEELWITVDPMECEGLAGCGSLPEISFATKTVQGHAIGEVAHYYCFPGLVFGDGSDSMMITCMLGGMWETPTFTRCH